MNDKQRDAAAAAYADLVEADDFEISPNVSPTNPPGPTTSWRT